MSTRDRLIQPGDRFLLPNAECNMEISLELLFHYRCATCGLWWSIGDRPPMVETSCPRPHCTTAHAGDMLDYQAPKDLSLAETLKLIEILQKVSTQLQAALPRSLEPDDVESLRKSLFGVAEVHRLIEQGGVGNSYTQREGDLKAVEERHRDEC